MPTLYGTEKILAEKCFGAENSPYLKRNSHRNGDCFFLTEKQKKQIPVVLSTLKADEIKNRKFFGKEYIKNDYVFKLENGEPYRPNYISKKHKQILEKYGFKHIRFHDLRHTHATVFLLFFHLFALDFTNLLWCFNRFSCTYSLNYTQISIECGFVVSLA